MSDKIKVLPKKEEAISVEDLLLELAKAVKEVNTDGRVITDFVLTLKAEYDDPENDNATLSDYQVISYDESTSMKVYNLNVALQSVLHDLGVNLI